MVGFHGRYNLGDKHPFRSPDDFLEFLRDEGNNVIALPLYLFDHSGLSMSTDDTMFRAFDSYGWDWGLVGYIYITLQDVALLYDLPGVSSVGDISPAGKSYRQAAIDCLRAEVNEYDNYLRGNVWIGYVASCESCGAELDSCWGFTTDKPKEILEFVDCSACKVCDEC